jgi:ubiquinone/menaquinone biosynthesis C-methylase UbiE
VRIDWDDGDYERVGRVLTPAAAALVEATGIGPGGRLLDVACGTGSAAFAATARGAHAVGVDEAEGLLAPARRRADREGAPVEFLVGDLHRLPVPDGAFDATVS